MSSPTDPFADALEKLGKSSEQLEKAAASFESVARDGWGMEGVSERLLRAAESMERTDEERRKRGDGDPSGGGRAAKRKRKKPGDGPEEEKGDGPAPRSRLRRAWDDSRMGQAFQKAEGRFRHRFGTEGPNHTGGLSKGMGMASKAVGAVAAVAAFVEKINEMRKQLENWTTAAIESKRKLAEMSGGMAGVFAKRDVDDLLRDQKMGDRMAGSTGKLAEAEGRRKDAGAPFQIAIENFKSELLAFLNDKVAEGYEKARGYINSLIEAVTKQKDFIPALPKDGAGDAFDAMVRPGGVVDMARDAEAAAQVALAKVKANRGLFERNAAEPKRLP